MSMFLFLCHNISLTCFETRKSPSGAVTFGAYSVCYLPIHLCQCHLIVSVALGYLEKSKKQRG